MTLSDKTLTPSALSSVGLKLIQNTCAVISETIFWGAYVVLMLIAIHGFLTADSPLTRSRVWMMLAVIIMFMMSTTLWALDFATATQQMKMELVSTADTFKKREESFSSSMNIRYFVQTLIFTAEIILGDAVVVWRACALWNNKKIVLFVSVLLLTTASVLLVFFMGCIGYTGWHFTSHESHVCDHAQLSTYAISLATNAWGTGWITYKAWDMYKFHRNLNALPKDTKTKANKILMLIAESGWIYLLIWISKCFTYLPLKGGPEFASGILNSIGNQIAGLYPTVLIVLVQSQRQKPWSSQGSSLPLPTIAFSSTARATTETSHSVRPHIVLEAQTESSQSRSMEAFPESKTSC